MPPTSVAEAADAGTARIRSASAGHDPAGTSWSPTTRYTSARTAPVPSAISRAILGTRSSVEKTSERLAENEDRVS